jgi:4-aminobutyrate aminotransferase-like enzyme
LCNSAANGIRDLSPVSETATGTFAASPYALPAASGVAAAISCEKIIQDAAQTTLMLDELQRWQKRQEIIQN